MSDDEDGSATGEHCHVTAAANQAVEGESGAHCIKCSSRIEHFDDAGFVFYFCPACDSKLRRDLLREREFMIREERRARGRLRR